MCGDRDSTIVPVGPFNHSVGNQLAPACDGSRGKRHWWRGSTIVRTLKQCTLWSFAIQSHAALAADRRMLQLRTDRPNNVVRFALSIDEELAV